VTTSRNRRRERRAAASPPKPPEADRSVGAVTSRVDRWIAVLLAAVTIVLYWPVHDYGFINFDDVDYVRSNGPVLAGLTLASVKWAFTSLLGSFWIPLTWLSFMLDSQLYGTGAGGYHVTNALLHVASSVLLFEILRRATGEPWPSVFVAGLFALHPLHVESVAWVTERKDVLSTLFLFLTLAAYGAYAARPTLRRYLLTLLVFVLGLMAKPMLVTLPILLLLVDLWPLDRFRRTPLRRLLVEKTPFLVLSVPAAFVTMFSGGHLDVSAPLAGVPIGTRLLNACENYVVYLGRTIWPSGLCVLYPEYDTPAWRAVLAGLGLAAATVLALRMARRRPYVIAGWGWYLVSLLPLIGMVRIGHFATADRFTYVPLIGIFTLVAWSAAELVTTPQRRVIARTAGAVLLLGATVAARVQLGYWRDAITLFERTIAVTGPNFVVQYLLGLALVDRGRTDEAMARYAEALRIRPGYVNALVSMGVLLFERGRVDEAIAHYQMALRGDPRDVFAHGNLANAFLSQGRTTEALAHYAEALRIRPEIAENHNGYGKALAAQGRAVEALAEYSTALRLKPDDVAAHNNLANALADRGAVDEAIAHYAEALRIMPTHVTARANFGRFLAEHGRYDEAIVHYREALRIKPDDARLHVDLGNALASVGKVGDAVPHFAEAVRLDPTYAGAHNNLANALVMLDRVDEGMSHYVEAIRLEPRYAEAHLNLGMVLASRGQTAEAIAHYTTALQIEPTYADAHTRLGIALREQGKIDEASKHFADALRIRPGDQTARQELEALRVTGH
jgi:tetratricopeptide (TPR) repeat protein